MAEKIATVNRISAMAGEMIIPLKNNGKPYSNIFLLTERKES